MVRNLIIIMLALSTFIFAAEKAPFSIDALYKLKKAADPQISPNGKKILFTVTSYNLEEGSSNSDIYVMNSDGKNLQRLTSNTGADYHPRWAPDGKKFLFLSSRHNGVQIWEMPAAGGEPVQLTDFYTEAADAEWAGNSGNIIFSSTVFPECEADQDCNKEILEDMENGPLQAHMADELLFRHWDSYKDGRRTHLILFNTKEKTYTDITPGDYDSPAHNGSFSISPDGSKVCVESNRGDFEAETTNKDLILIDIQTRQAGNLTRDNEAYDGQPVFSPDGRYIAYQQQKIEGYESDLLRLAVYDVKKGSSRTLTEDFDAWTENYTWGPKSKYVYFRAHQKGHFPIHRIDVKSGKMAEVVDVKTPNEFVVDPDGKWLAISRRTIKDPNEIVKAKIEGKSKGKKAVRLTFFNKAVEDSVDIRPAEELWIPSPKTGKKIHTYIIKPHNFDPGKKYPLILNIHGGPQYQWYDGFRGDWQVYPGAGYVVAFPNPHGSSGYGQEFTRAISEDYTGKVYDDILAVTDSLANLGYIDDNRMGAMGWSWGGYMMMWLEGQDNRFKTLVSMMGIFNLTSKYGATEELWFPEFDNGGAPWENREYYQKNSPHMYVENFKTPCLVITGEKDYRVSYTQSLEFFTALQKMRVPSRLIIFKNDGHWPDTIKSMPFYYNAHLDWFHKYLGGRPAPYDMKKMHRNQAFKK